MAIEEIAIEGPEARVSGQVARLIETCSRGWERFFADNDDSQAPRFVPSVPERVFAVLQEVTTRNLPPTRVFCEWGSGFGTVTCMAALLGYEAYGLEIDAELVWLSRAIARRLRISVEILCTSLFPEGYEADAGVDGAALVRPASRSNPNANDTDRRPLRYDGMAIDITAIGVFFAYPWPEEQELMQQLFDAVAREGAILVVYHTDTDIRVFRKVAEKVSLSRTTIYNGFYLSTGTCVSYRKSLPVAGGGHVDQG
ncbi:MAG TPA: hypothetical protein VI542_14370 [Candidatus Tectomicrobia bacterium]